MSTWDPAQGTFVWIYHCEHGDVPYGIAKWLNRETLIGASSGGLSLTRPAWSDQPLCVYDQNKLSWRVISLLASIFRFLSRKAQKSTWTGFWPICCSRSSLCGRRKMTISPLHAAINGQRYISCAKDPIMRSQMLENLLEIDACRFRAITLYTSR